MLPIPHCIWIISPGPFTLLLFANLIRNYYQTRDGILFFPQMCVFQNSFSKAPEIQANRSAARGKLLVQYNKSGVFFYWGWWTHKHIFLSSVMKYFYLVTSQRCISKLYKPTGLVHVSWAWWRNLGHIWTSCPPTCVPPHPQNQPELGKWLKYFVLELSPGQLWVKDNSGLEIFKQSGSSVSSSQQSSHSCLILLWQQVQNHDSSRQEQKHSL